MEPRDGRQEITGPCRPTPPQPQGYRSEEASNEIAIARTVDRIGPDETPEIGRSRMRKRRILASNAGPEITKHLHTRGAQDADSREHERIRRDDPRTPIDETAVGEGRHGDQIENQRCDDAPRVTSSPRLIGASLPFLFVLTCRGHFFRRFHRSVEACPRSMSIRTPDADSPIPGTGRAADAVRLPTTHRSRCFGCSRLEWRRSARRVSSASPCCFCFARAE
jgi:hypothetical protein